MSAHERILVIKHSALGDFILATAAFQAIRRHHPAATITLLTTKPYRGIAEASGLFDEILLDERPPLSRPLAMLKLLRTLRAERFTRVYDLQRSNRTGWYFRLWGPGKPEWVGPAKGASHFFPGAKAHKHIADREAKQLALVGIHDLALPDLSFLSADLDRFALPERFALLVPGGAPHRPAKRWPAEHFAALAQHLSERGVIPVLLGTKAEAQEIAAIREACPQALDLHGQTDFADLAELGRHALLAVGNDTGPMHLLAAAGCPSVVLFSAESDPVRISPRGVWVCILQRESLRDLPPEAVSDALPPLE